MKIPKLTRRKFIAASGATVATVAMSKYLLDWTGRSLLADSETTEPVEKWLPTTCWIGKQECGMLARVVDGRIIKFEGHPNHPRNRGRLCPKGQAQLMSIYDPYRVKAPLRRTNGKGITGEWKEISWDEALAEVAAHMNAARAKDPKFLVWQKGRSKAGGLYDGAFVKASGATTMHHGALGADAGARANEYTLGFSGGFNPDFRHCNYLLSWGWNLTNAGGNHTCWMTWPQQFVEARKRGMKLVALDPRRRGVGPHADQWLPIKPGGDLAFFLAISNVLVGSGYIDEEYLKKHTNSPFLIKDDGHFLKVDGKEQIWDTITNSARPHDAQGISPALDGAHTVSGTSTKTSFQLFKEHVAQYTPEWASVVCGLPANSIRQVANELGDHAKIGSTIVIDGVEVPYRPVGLMAYHVSQQELGFQAFRAAAIAFMLLGAFETAGGPRVDFSRSIHENFKGLDEISIGDPPYNIYLKDSKYYPINSNNSSIAAQVMLDPDKYGVDYTPEVMIIHMCNPAISFPDQPSIWEAYKKFKFIAVIDPFMSETADYFADVVLPAATIEKYEGPQEVTDQYDDAQTLRLPPIAPLYQSRGEIDIYIDLCGKAGILYGDGGYIDQVNSQLKLTGPNKLDLNTRPEVRDIFDRWAKSSGYDDGIAFFEQHGVKVTPFAAEKYYASVWDKPYGGVKHRLYGESLLGYQEVMKQKNAEEIYWHGYTALPTWRKPTMDQSPDEYDLYLISHKKIEFKQSRTTFNALLNELEPEQQVQMNSEAAKTRDIEDGDLVNITSQNAITGETRTVQAKAKVLEGIRPDTVAMSHHYGFWVHPLTKECGPTPNHLFYSGAGYVTETADQSYHVKVKITKV